MLAERCVSEEGACAACPARCVAEHASCASLAGLASAVAPPRTLALGALEKADLPWSLPWRCGSLCT